MAVVEAEKLGAEADREGFYADAAPAADEVVAHFMNEDDDGQHEQKRHQRAEDKALRAEKRVKYLVQVVPSNSPTAKR
ncbi:hypothetical protein NKH15_14290 [Mesorhizobium caraganae]